MKPLLEKDFTISVRHQTLEELPENAQFYEGIYAVTLNFLVTIMFVPKFEKEENRWPPELPDNLDEISTTLEARLSTIALSSYTVTPNTFLSGKQEEIPLILDFGDTTNSDIELKKGVIFYTTHREFEMFSQELSMLAEETPSVHDYVRISQVQEVKVAQYILGNIVESKHFSERDLEILGRQKETRKKMLSKYLEGSRGV